MIWLLWSLPDGSAVKAELKRGAAVPAPGALGPDAVESSNCMRSAVHSDSSPRLLHLTYKKR